jgi:hypothetical protein
MDPKVSHLIKGEGGKVEFVAVAAEVLTETL